MRIGILTVSDLGAVGQREDTSGDAILAWAGERGYDVAVRSVVPDESDRIAGMLARWADSGEVDVILTTGGTGLTLRDVTPEATHAVRINAHLETAGFHTTLVSSFDDVRRAVGGAGGADGSDAAPAPDCIVLTGGLHESSAAQLLRIAHDRSISTLGLVESTEPDPKEAARRLGLTSFLVKPADPTEVSATVRRLIERRRLQARTGILGESPAIQEVLVKIEQMAPVSATVLIEGESGTGKELVAHAIHDLSPRRAKPFIAVNCAAIPATLLERELFGH